MFYYYISIYLIIIKIYSLKKLFRINTSIPYYYKMVQLITDVYSGHIGTIFYDPQINNNCSILDYTYSCRQYFKLK